MLLTTLSSGILSTCPTQLSLLLLMCLTIFSWLIRFSNSSFVFCLHSIFVFCVGAKILLNNLLSNINNFCLIFYVNTQHSDPYTTTTKQHCSETFLHKSERCEVLPGYLSLGRRPGSDWANTWHWIELLESSFETGISGSPSYLQILFLIASLEEAYQNLIIMPCINSIIITRVNNNNNNNSGRLQDLNWPFKISMGTREYFEIYRQFGYEPSKHFACPSLDGTQLTLQLFHFALSFKGLIWSAQCLLCLARLAASKRS